MTRMKCRIRIGPTKQGIREPSGSYDPDGGHHSWIGRKGTQYTCASLKDFLIAQSEHGLCFSARYPGS